MGILPHSRRFPLPVGRAADTSTRLTAAEREVTLTIADDEQHWHVFTDSARLTRRLLRVAEQWGIQPARLGAGFEFELPLRAVRFAAPSAARAPASDAQRAALALGREARQKALFHATTLDRNQGSAPRAARAEPDAGVEGHPGAGRVGSQTPV